MKFAAVAALLLPLLGTVHAEYKLKDLAAARGKHYGVAYDVNEVADPVSLQVIKDHSGFSTFTNVLKWMYTEPANGQFDFTVPDAQLKIAESLGIPIRGHNLVWHSQLASWVENGNWTYDSLKAVVERHATTLVRRYRGRLIAWDVTNEIIQDDGTWRPTVFYNVLGEDFVEIALRAAHKADPKVKLYLNDYNLESGLTPKVLAYVSLVKKLKSKGVPIHGVGAQGHLIVGGVNEEDVYTSLKAFTDLGVEVTVTELDIRGNLNFTTEMYAQQKKDYYAVVNACNRLPACFGVMQWDSCEQYSWIPSWFTNPPQGDALPFDKNCKPKSAFDGIVEALLPHPATTTVDN